MRVIKNECDIFLERLNQNQMMLEDLVVEEDEAANIAIIQAKIIELKALYIEYILNSDISSCV
jgi:hypothetical protein